MLFSCVISIGKEIVNGSINDTNSFYLSSKLTSIGVNNRYIIAIDDDERDIIENFLYYLNRVDIVITTGGLGPTFDDMTVVSIAKALKRNMVLSKDAYKKIETFYKRLFEEKKITSKDMNVKRKKMAYIPENSIELENRVGAAPGVYIKEKNKHIFCLPGVPNEMKFMFERSVLPILKGMSEGVTISRTYEFEINDETVLTQAVDAVKAGDVYIKSLPAGFDSKTMGVRFTTSGKNESECLKKIETVKNNLERILYEFK